MKLIKYIIAIILFFTVLCNADECITLKQIEGNSFGDDYLVQYAINKAKTENKTCVRLAGGVWNFYDAVYVPTGITIKGTYNSPHDYSKAGTNIACHKANVTPMIGCNGDAVCDTVWSSCVHLKGSAGLHGVTMIWPDNNTDKYGIFSPNPYPPAVSCDWGDGVNNGWDPGRCSIKNVTLAGAYNGIYGGHVVNDHHFEGLRIGAYNKAVFLDNISSLGIIENIEVDDKYIWQYFEKNGIIISNDVKESYRQEWLRKSMIAFEFRRSDWGDIRNVKIVNAAFGYLFALNKQYTPEHPFGSGGWENPQVYMNDISCIGCTYAIYAESVQKPAGIQINNANLDGKIFISYDNWGPIHIANSILSYTVKNQTDTHIYQDCFHCELSIFNTIINTYGSVNIPINIMAVYIKGRTLFSLVNLYNNGYIGNDFYHVRTFDKGTLMWVDGEFNSLSQLRTIHQKVSGETVVPGQVYPINVNFKNGI